MKELSLQEKAEAYDKAKARMMRAVNNNRCSLYFMREIFSESEEDKDERIRKALMFILKSDFEKDTTIYDISVGDIIDWLGKIPPKNRWTPTNKQIEALQYVYRNLNPPLSDKLGWDSIKTLELMCRDLKKLRKE